MRAMRIFFREHLVIVAVFLTSFAVQLLLWFGPLPYKMDVDFWSDAAKHFAAAAPLTYFPHIAPHPGTTILVPSAGLILLGIPNESALQYTIAFLMSLCVAVIAYICRVLRPKNLWWLGVCALFILNPLYLQMSVVSDLAALLVCIYLLLLLYAREKGFSREILFWLGMCGGVLLATRHDAGGIVMFSSAVYLWPLIGRRVLNIFAIALLFFGALNPFLWENPQLYVSFFIRELQMDSATPGGFGLSVLVTGFALVAFSLGLISTFFLRTLSPLPRDFLKWLLVVSALWCGLLLLSKGHTMRYFFPLISIWEMFLPLFIFSILERYQVRFLNAKKSKLEHIFVELLILALIIPVCILLFA